MAQLHPPHTTMSSSPSQHSQTLLSVLYLICEKSNKIKKLKKKKKTVPPGADFKKSKQCFMEFRVTVIFFCQALQQVKKKKKLKFGIGFLKQFGTLSQVSNCFLFKNHSALRPILYVSMSQ